MVRRFDSQKRKVYYIQPGDDLDQVLVDFLISDCTDVEGVVNETRIGISRGSIESRGAVHGINPIKEMVNAIKKDFNEDKSSQE